MRIRDWYFQGWERRETAGKSVLVYTGETYSFPGGLRPHQRRTAFLTAALVLVYLGAALLPSPGGMWHYAAVPQLLELIPLIYLVMGLVRLLLAKVPFTYRDWYASWRRMKHAAAWSLGAAALMAAVEIVYLLFAAEDPSLPRELLYLLEALVCAALSFALFCYIRKHPCITSAPSAEKE